MSNTTDRVAFAAAELNAASDALASAAAEVDALRAEVARQTGIAVDHCARADTAEQMVVELREKARAYLGAADLGGVQERAALISALSRTEAVAGRWVPAAERDEVMAERDAAIAARDEAVARLEKAKGELYRLGGLADERGVLLKDAERARDEVGIQLAAAQAEIARLRRVVDEARTLMATPAGERLPAERAVCDALHALDTVHGDALAPRITAALEASGIDTSNVKGLE